MITCIMIADRLNNKGFPASSVVQICAWPANIFTVTHHRDDPFLYVTLDHKASLKSLGYICSNSQKYTAFILFLSCQKSLGH